MQRKNGNQRLLKDFKDVVFKSLCLNVKNILQNMNLNDLLDISEIRLRIDKPLMICMSSGDMILDKNGKQAESLSDAYIVRKEDVFNCLQLISQYSLYSIEEELTKGYVTLKGGHRVGITGRAVIEKGNIKTIKYINGLNYRIMREIPGCGTEILKIIRKGDSDIYHTLIAGPPRTGKTTLLRDIVRQISTGNDAYRGLKVGVIDERSEIAGCYKGIPQNNIGLRTDVLDCCPKAQGIINIIRSMSPEVIVTDEIGSHEDLISIHEALNAGVKIVTTVHGADMNELLNRPYICQMLKDKLFEKIIFLNNSKGVGTITQVIETKDLNMIKEEKYYA